MANISLTPLTMAHTPTRVTNVSSDRSVDQLPTGLAELVLGVWAARPWERAQSLDPAGRHQLTEAAEQEGDADQPGHRGQALHAVRQHEHAVPDPGDAVASRMGTGGMGRRAHAAEDGGGTRWRGLSGHWGGVPGS